MSQLDHLQQMYAQHIKLPWPRSVSGPQRVVFLVYDEDEERRIRARLEDYHLATRQARHGWHQVDLTEAFAEWMAAHPYRDGYFESPRLLTGAALAPFRRFVVQRVRAALLGSDGDGVVAVTGVAGLFGLLRVSEVVREVETDILGRLVVFFPGAYRNNVYRLLDRRDGWNYLALPLANS